MTRSILLRPIQKDPMPRRLALILFLLATVTAFAQQHSDQAWRFAVSGDSRNCGDVVMPAIAQSVKAEHPAFYWHLGDFRAMYDVDEDLQRRYSDKLSLTEYRQIAWSDFLENQVRPFDPVPVFLGIGNHEVAFKTPTDFLAAFGYWLDTPELHNQRVNEYSVDTSLKTYYHWRERNVDFIYLDNSGDDGFDSDQIQWFEHLLARDKADSEIKTLVVGMHRALPNSLACGHSMNGDIGGEHPKSIDSGRRAYADLVQWRKDTQRFVYVLASHSHFYMDDIYQTDYWKNHAEVLPGWIVGTAGAKRYRLPELPSDVLTQHNAQTKVWGYLLATVAPSGEIKFEFKKLGVSDVPDSVRKLYGDFVESVCDKGNVDFGKHDPPPSCFDK